MNAVIRCGFTALIMTITAGHMAGHMALAATNSPPEQPLAANRQVPSETPNLPDDQRVFAGVSQTAVPLPDTGRLPLRGRSASPVQGGNNLNWMEGGGG